MTPIEFRIVAFTASGLVNDEDHPNAVPNWPTAVRDAIEQQMAGAVPPAVPKIERYWWFRDQVRQAYNQVALSASFGGWTLDTSSPVDSIPYGEWWIKVGGGVAFPLIPPSPNLLTDAETGQPIAMFVSVYEAIDGSVGEHCCEYSVANPEHGPHGVALFFPAGRSMIRGIDLVGFDETTLDAPLSPSSSNQLVYLFDFSAVRAEIRGNKTLRFKVRFVGDPPFIRHVTWLVDTPEEPALDGPLPDRYPFQQATVLLSQKRSFEDELEIRRAAIDPPSTPNRRAKQFFLEMEEQCHPLAQNDGTGAHFGQVASYLQFRYFDRAQSSRWSQPVFASSPHELETWRLVAANTEAAFRGVLQGEFGTAAAFDLDRFREYFEQFAVGELTVVDTQGAPNGITYLCFAEFALLMLDLGIESSFWGDCLRVFAATAEMFSRAYAADCKGGSTCAYRKQRGVAPHIVNVAEVRADWQLHDTELKLSTAFGELAATMLSEEIGRPTPAPNPWALQLLFGSTQFASA